MTDRSEARRRLTLERCLAMKALPEAERNDLIAAAPNVIDLRPLLQLKREAHAPRISGSPFDGDLA